MFIENKLIAICLGHLFFWVGLYSEQIMAPKRKTCCQKDTTFQQRQIDALQQLVQHKIVILQQVESDINVIQRNFLHDMQQLHAQKIRLRSEHFVAQENLKNALVRDKDPLLQHFSGLVPVSIIELMIDYNSSLICPDCLGYYPRKTVCQRTKGHSYECNNNDLPIVDGSAKFSTVENKEMWEDFQAAVIGKSKNVDTFVYEVKKKFGQRPFLFIAADKQCAGIKFSLSCTFTHADILMSVIARTKRKKSLMKLLK